VASVNPATLRNPESLAEYAALGERLRRELGAEAGAARG
jgi:hypothetical protein